MILFLTDIKRSRLHRSTWCELNPVRWTMALLLLRWALRPGSFPSTCHLWLITLSRALLRPSCLPGTQRRRRARRRTLKRGLGPPRGSGGPRSYGMARGYWRGCQQIRVILKITSRRISDGIWTPENGWAGVVILPQIDWHFRHVSCSNKCWSFFNQNTN